MALNRLLRVGGFALLMAVVGHLARPLVRRRPLLVTLVYIAGWAAFYVAFWTLRTG